MCARVPVDVFFVCLLYTSMRMLREPVDRQTQQHQHGVGPEAHGAHNYEDMTASTCARAHLNMECERELSAFIFVAPT